MVNVSLTGSHFRLISFLRISFLSCQKKQKKLNVLISFSCVSWAQQDIWILFLVTLTWKAFLYYVALPPALPQTRVFTNLGLCSLLGDLTDFPSLELFRALKGADRKRKNACACGACPSPGLCNVLTAQRAREQEEDENSFLRRKIAT